MVCSTWNPCKWVSMVNKLNKEDNVCFVRTLNNNVALSLVGLHAYLNMIIKCFWSINRTDILISWWRFRTQVVNLKNRIISYQALGKIICHPWTIKLVSLMNVFLISNRYVLSSFELECNKRSGSLLNDIGYLLPEIELYI